jgi:hypothetical protein
MKTKESHLRKLNYWLVAFLFIMIFSLAYAMEAVSAPGKGLQGDVDTTRYETFNGKIIDSQTGEPLVFANVVLRNTNIGTVTNADGEYLIKAPGNWGISELEITHIGYRSRIVKMSGLNGQSDEIALDPSTVQIPAVTVSYGDPLELLRNALRNIPENYSADPVMMKAFYRETIKQNRNYVGVAEAVLDIYKTEYDAVTGPDRTQIYKGRKSQDVKRMDTIVVKLQGGPFISLMLDIAKHPGEILSEDYLGWYEYAYGGLTTVQDREAMIINFNPRKHITDPLYSGKIYLDTENLAIIGADFSLDEERIGEAADAFIRKKPVTMKVDIESVNHLTKYRVNNGTWYLSYVRTELNFRCRWQRKLFSSNYSLMSEMAITDVSTDNLNKFKLRETTRVSDILAEQVYMFEDPDFWGRDNIIKPDESIEAAIDKLSRRLKRRM